MSKGKLIELCFLSSASFSSAISGLPWVTWGRAPPFVGIPVSCPDPIPNRHDLWLHTVCPSTANHQSRLTSFHKVQSRIFGAEQLHLTSSSFSFTQCWGNSSFIVSDLKKDWHWLLNQQPGLFFKLLGLGQVLLVMPHTWTDGKHMKRFYIKLFFFTHCQHWVDHILACFRSGRCHGVALWMEYNLTSDITVSAGLIGPISEQVMLFNKLKQLCTLSCGFILTISLASSPQGDCEWSRHRKQGVYFLRSAWDSSGDSRAAMSYSFTFEPSLGDIKMDFSVESQWCGAFADWRTDY